MSDNKKPPIQYIPKFVEFPTEAMSVLQKELNWERREQTPRSEYYINTLGNIPYVYGVGNGRRRYDPRPIHPVIQSMIDELKKLTGYDFEVCFLNRYHNQSDQLGWHSDDSPEMDDARPIVIISLGVEREIWFSEMKVVGDRKKPSSDVYRQKLEHGSLCLMQPGMQDTHLHRIPKASFLCGERISLTFRGYVKPK